MAFHRGGPLKNYFHANRLQHFTTDTVHYLIAYLNTKLPPLFLSISRQSDNTVQTDDFSSK